MHTDSLLASYWHRTLRRLPSRVSDNDREQSSNGLTLPAAVGAFARPLTLRPVSGFGHNTSLKITERYRKKSKKDARRVPQLLQQIRLELYSA